MPNETQQAVNWALGQSYADGFGVHQVNDNGKINKGLLVSYVRKYFNDNNVAYSTFSYDDLTPYLK